MDENQALEIRAVEAVEKLDIQAFKASEKLEGQAVEAIKKLDNQAVEVAEKLINSASHNAKELIDKASVDAIALIKEAVEVAKALRSRVKQLEGIIPICSYCKKIRDDMDSWHQMEGYISKYSDAEFSHGICPECYEKHKDD